MIVMKKNKIIYVVLMIAMLLILPACEGQDLNDEENSSGSVTEENESAPVEDSIDSTETAGDEVSPEFDENGNPTGDYARYLWEQQQAEDAMNSLAEDAMREQQEEDYETYAFPLD